MGLATTYSDRLILNNFEKWERLAQKHFGNTGQDFSLHPPEKIETFMQDYFGQPGLKVVSVQQENDVSTGPPTFAIRVKLDI